MQDAQGVQSGGELLGLHRRAVVAHQRPRQPALLQRLPEAMHQGLGGLVQIPLQMADQAGVIVDDRQQQRRGPDAGAGEHLARAVMKVQMPQGMDILGLVAAHLAGLQAPGGLLGPRRAARMDPTPVQAGALHEAAHAWHRRATARGSRRLPPRRRGCRSAAAPSSRGARGTGRCTASISRGVEAALHARHRAVGAGAAPPPGPARRGRGSTSAPTWQSRNARGRPVTGCRQSLAASAFKPRPQFSRRRWIGQQRADDGKAQPRPTIGVTELFFVGHAPLLPVCKYRARSLGRRPRGDDHIFCGSLLTLAELVDVVHRGDQHQQLHEPLGKSAPGRVVPAAIRAADRRQAAA